MTPSSFIPCLILNRAACDSPYILSNVPSITVTPIVRPVNITCTMLTCWYWNNPNYSLAVDMHFHFAEVELEYDCSSMLPLYFTIHKSISKLSAVSGRLMVFKPKSTFISVHHIFFAFLPTLNNAFIFLAWNRTLFLCRRCYGLITLNGQCSRQSKGTEKSVLKHLQIDR